MIADFVRGKSVVADCKARVFLLLHVSFLATFLPSHYLIPCYLEMDITFKNVCSSKMKTLRMFYENSMKLYQTPIKPLSNSSFFDSVRMYSGKKKF